MTDFLDQKRSEILKRLDELQPLVDEYQRLEAASSALEQVTGSASARSNGAPRAGRTGAARGGARTAGARRTAASGRAKTGAAAGGGRRTTAARRGAGRVGRRRGSGARTAQTLELVQAQPAGITIPDLAAKMGIKQNYLYRVLPALQKEGKVRKRGRTWLPRAA